MTKTQKEYVNNLVLEELKALDEQRTKVLDAIRTQKMRIVRLENMLEKLDKDIEINSTISKL